MALKVGSKAPSFALKDKDGKLHKLDNVRSDYTVLYFYPKDDTPGCTIEAKEFTKDLSNFRKAKATVIGISGGDAKSKKNFCNKYGLKVTLVSDPSFATAKKYGSYGKKSFMGKTYTGVLRNTYLLDKNKKVVKVFDSVTPKGHTKELLSWLTTAGKKSASAGKAAAKSKKSAKPATTKRTAKRATAAKKPTRKATRRATPKAATRAIGRKTATRRAMPKKATAAKKTTARRAAKGRARRASLNRM